LPASWARAFIAILRQHATAIDYADSMSALHDKEQLGGLHEFLGEVLDSKCPDEKGAAALLLTSMCQSFAVARRYSCTEQLMPALFRAIKRDSPFAQAAAAYRDAVRTEEETLRSWSNASLFYSDLDAEHSATLYDTLREEPVWRALAAEFERRDAVTLLKLSAVVE